MAQLGVVGNPVAPKEPTITERLNISASQIDTMCDRIETMLARVNATPSNAQATGKERAGAPSLIEITNRFESISQRLCSLVDGVERIA